MNAGEMSEVIEVIRGAFLDTVSAAIVEPDRGHQNKRRSQRFIRAINKGLRGMFSAPSYSDRRVGVLSKGVESNVPGLKIKQELLFDVHAFEYDVVPSPANQADLCIIKGSLIQLESELANDTKEIVTDFGKLVCGRADMKIMIMPRVQAEPELSMDLMRGIALNIPEPLILILVPYPDKWHPEDEQAREGAFAFRFLVTDGGGLWQAVKAGEMV